jgi:hypothetical protein
MNVLTFSIEAVMSNDSPLDHSDIALHFEAQSHGAEIADEAAGPVYD